MELADTSAWRWTRRIGGALRRQFDERVADGEIATCDIVRLELLYSTRDAAEFDGLRRDLTALHDCPIDAAHWHRALDVYGELARSGPLHHRAVPHPDLLVAAAAEGGGIAVLHYDEDYERIAAVTGQKTHWLAPRGSLV